MLLIFTTPSQLAQIANWLKLKRLVEDILTDRLNHHLSLLHGFNS